MCLFVALYYFTCLIYRRKSQDDSQFVLYHCLQVYKLCAEHEALPHIRKDGSEEAIRDRRIVLLSRSKDALYLTLDRIRGDRFHVCC